ncbi:MAG: K(+)-transporting ATPase subunit F [Chloroflexaceae bacterium]|nr:K(+)-transporting ATPase subunit F [Chloroflexaceae bacterium]
MKLFPQILKFSRSRPPVLPSFKQVKDSLAKRENDRTLSSLITTIDLIWTEWRRRIPLWLFLGLCLNVAIAPMVYAAAGGTLERGNAYAIGVLGLATVGLSVYLFVVIFQPERF